MKRHASSARNKTWFGRALAVLVVVAAVPLTALGAERMVLCEDFHSKI